MKHTRSPLPPPGKHDGSAQSRVCIHPILTDTHTVGEQGCQWERDVSRSPGLTQSLGQSRSGVCLWSLSPTGFWASGEHKHTINLFLLWLQQSRRHLSSGGSCSQSLPAPLLRSSVQEMLTSEAKQNYLLILKCL